MIGFYGKEMYFSNELIKDEIGQLFRGFDETLIDMARDFIEKGFVEKIGKKMDDYIFEDEDEG